MTLGFRVGEWLVEPELNSITTGDRKVSLGTKVIEVLVCLADHAGEVLSKEQIIHAVWPDTYVREDVLRYSISELRKALDDDANNPRIIQTIARRGYRLMLEVSRESAPVSRGSIAVLAFDDMSSAKDQEYFCDGVAEEIISYLSRIRGLQVSSRTSSFAFKSKPEDIRSIGKKLGVASVLEGSVRKAGNQIRVTAQLIGTDDGYHLWSQQYDREMNDIFAIQDEIARSIAATVETTLNPAAIGVTRKGPITGFETRNRSLQGGQAFGG